MNPPKPYTRIMAKTSRTPPPPPPPDDPQQSAPLEPLTERQEALLKLLQGLDPNYRYTITLNCRGSEPWKVEKLLEHQDIDLRPPLEKPKK